MFELSNNSLGPLLLGVLAGIFLTASLSFPRVGRAISKTCAVILLAVGAGLIAWGITGLSSGSFEPLEFGPVLFSSDAQAIGWGAGGLVGGTTSLVLSFVGGHHRPH